MSDEARLAVVAAAMRADTGMLRGRWLRGCTREGLSGSLVEAVAARLDAGDGFAAALAAAGVDPVATATADAALRTGTVRVGAAPAEGVLSAAAAGWRWPAAAAATLWLLCLLAGVRPWPVAALAAVAVAVGTGCGWWAAGRAGQLRADGRQAGRWWLAAAAMTDARRLSPDGLADCGWTSAGRMLAAGEGVEAALAEAGAPAELCAQVAAGAGADMLAAAGARRREESVAAAQRAAGAALTWFAAAGAAAVAAALLG